MKKRILCLALPFLLFSGCKSNSDADKIATAQRCLDSASPTTAMSCVDSISDLTSSGAYLLKCAAQFIRQGFSDPATLAQAIGQMQSSNPGAGTTAAAIDIFSFTTEGSASANTTLANSTYGNCSKSNSGGMILFSFMSTTATAARECQSGGSMSSALTCLKGNGGIDKSTMGTALLDSYNQNCTAGKNFDPTLCAQMSAAITASDGSPADVAAEFLNNY